MDKNVDLDYSSGRGLVTLARNNARALTDEALDTAWRDAFSVSMNAESAHSRKVWAEIRDIFGAEIDARKAGE